MYPILANALQFAFDKATTEGRLTIGVLLLVSFFSWSVIITKALQLATATRMSRRFFAAYREAPDPLQPWRQGHRFDGAPVFALYAAGATELESQLTKSVPPVSPDAEPRLSPSGFDVVRLAIEEAAIEQALALEKGMTVLSTAVAGGPFLGLLGTVWGVMETFAGIAKSNAASLTAMAPGVAGALIATVVGLFVAIPAMFAYNFMVTRIRAFTQELDGFALRFATQIEHRHVEDRSISEEVAQAVERVLRARENLPPQPSPSPTTS
ncbi:MAG: MotA/TolQ/ExbB proton channel family protein [Verrucomicrobiales bacterium]|nr:MotA/TolQ/ExbB proton channel family protein [Verrucomicrobiales bacterium]